MVVIPLTLTLLSVDEDVEEFSWDRLLLIEYEDDEAMYCSE